MLVQTKVGPLEVPDAISDRTKYWVGAITDLARLEELYGVMEMALREAYHEGTLGAFAHFVRGWNSKPEVIETKYEIIPRGDNGSVNSEPVAVSQADGSAELSVADGGVSGGGQEVPERLSGNAEKVEEDSKSCGLKHE